MAITEANTLTLQEEEITEDKYKDFLVRVKGLYSFKKETKDLIDFSYYDILNKKNLPKFDLVIMRDVLSYFNEENFSKVIENINENVVHGTYFLVGDNELLENSNSLEQFFKVQRQKSAEHISLYKIVKQNNFEKDDVSSLANDNI